MQIKADEISSIIKEKIKGFDKQVDVKETGSVIQVGDGIAKVYGLDGAMAGEMLEFPGGLYGIALNLEEDNVGAVLLGSDAKVKEGDTVAIFGIGGIVHRFRHIPPFPHQKLALPYPHFYCP